MALSVDTTFRDHVAYRLWNSTYANLPSGYQPSLIDSEGGLVLTQLQYYANYFSMAATGLVAPDAWMPWFVAETVYKLAATTHPAGERVRAFKSNRDIAMQNSLTTFCRKVIDYNPSSDAEAFTYTFQALRYHIVNVCIRQKPSVFPAIETIDASIDWALKWVWNKGGWIYRRRQTDFDISAAGAITWDLSDSEVFDSFATRVLYYTDAAGKGMAIRWADADEMAAWKSIDGTETGRPELFRIQRSGDTETWFFTPAPDAAYNVRAEILVRPPANPASVTATAPFSKFAADHLPHLRDLALAKAMYDQDSVKYAALFREVCQRIEADFANYQDIGEVDSQMTTRDVYNDWNALPSSTMFGGGQ